MTSKHFLSLLACVSIAVLLFSGCSSDEKKLVGQWEEVDSKMPVNSEFEFFDDNRFQYNSSYVGGDTISKYKVYKGTYKLKTDTLFTWSEENPDKVLFGQKLDFQGNDKITIGPTVYKRK